MFNVLCKNARISPRKARKVVSLIKGKGVEDAYVGLKHGRSKGARIFIDVLKSAVANAKNNHGVEEKDLVVVSVWVNEGMRLKRARSCGKGGRNSIIKRFSHISITLSKEGLV